MSGKGHIQEGKQDLPPRPKPGDLIKKGGRGTPPKEAKPDPPAPPPPKPKSD